MNSATIVLACGETGEYSEELALRCVARGGVTVLVMPHLYHLRADSPLWDELRALPAPLYLISPLHPRAAAWVLRRQGVSVEDAALFNIEAFADAHACLTAVRKACNLEDGLPALPPRRYAEESTPRWYPVLDKSRCVNCGHCLQFCLFGVYTAGEDGEVVATNPDRCKPGCPACSRICPQGAIIFPLYAKNAAIAGAPGLFMQPDPAARKMYYLRTGQPCPLCGQHENSTGSGRVCNECGRPVPEQAETAAEESEVFTEIDALIDAVDEIARRRS